MAIYEYWRGMLSSAEQRCYDLFCASGSKPNRMIPMPISDEEPVMCAWQAFLIDHPEHYNYSGEIRFQWEGERFFSFGARSLSVSPCPLYDPLRQRYYMHAMQERLKEFDGGIAMVHGDLERERYIVDFISQGAAYEIRMPFTCTASGALVDHRAQCIGFAKACKLLCDRIGLQCLIAEGNLKNGEGPASHAWNIVWIDGQCYHLDVTSIIGSGGLEQGGTFFNQTDPQLAELGYTWERDRLPVCAASFDRGRFASTASAPCFRDLFSLRGYLQQQLSKRPRELSFFLNLSDRSKQELLQLVNRTLSSEMKKQNWYVRYAIEHCHGISGERVKITFSL